MYHTLHPFKAYSSMVFSICSLSPAVCVFTGAFLQVKELEVA